jgi:hypothetical protein
LKQGAGRQPCTQRSPFRLSTELFQLTVSA